MSKTPKAKSKTSSPASSPASAPSQAPSIQSAPLPANGGEGNGMTVEALKESFQDHRMYSLAKDQYTATPHDNFMTLSLAVRDRMIGKWIRTQQKYHKQNLKRVYYLSMEFLIGKLLRSSILNLGIEPQARRMLEAYGLELGDLVQEEYDAGLGNGGLGRLAACFLDSMATLGVPANGYGIMYNYGIFHQKIVNGRQVEVPDEWLRLGTPWAIERPEYTIRVRFNGRTHQFIDKDGRLSAQWLDTDDVLAVPCDFPVPGYQTDAVNTLRLWAAHGTEEFGLDYFNTGDYLKAHENKITSETISKVLYPVDTFSGGLELRLKQEYFFSAASLADIVRRFKAHNADFRDFPKKVAIQLNDTHPSLAIPELMRILLDEERMEWDDAWRATVDTFAYTNHTLLPEALETWTIPLLGRLLPRHLEIIYEINARFLREVANEFPGDADRLRRMSIIEEGEPKRLRMAHLSVAGSHSINGVSALHSELVKSGLFRDFHDLWPERFNNKTNGVTPRRWILESNPRLSRLLDETVGERWPTDLLQLKGLLKKQNDAAFLERWRRIKRDNKADLAGFLDKRLAFKTDPDSLFDIQVKRVHEYKRQILFAFYLIHKYLDVKHSPNKEHVPRTAMFGGKAAPGYGMAKLIIKFINSVGGVINGDKRARGLLRVLFLEDYRVSLAQRIVGACDLSEQISTAGTEASGTGCMKFMMNGALTIGTLDGANIEIREEAGAEHFFAFGLKANEVVRLRQDGYRPREFVERSPALAEVIGLIQSEFFSQIEPGLF
ncbi:MAG: glycogen/starch/alpha-glucan phosphorylase, partial [Elusimicrobia bacterium]|nr:glycogen/starch/alpha-glucan phosphorylase [Elusimicrobiota bacterium]